MPILRATYLQPVCGENGGDFEERAVLPEEIVQRFAKGRRPVSIVGWSGGAYWMPDLHRVSFIDRHVGRHHAFLSDRFAISAAVDRER